MITLNLSDEESDALVEAVGLALRHFPHSPDYRFDALLSLLSLLLGK